MRLRALICGGLAALALCGPAAAPAVADSVLHAGGSTLVPNGGVVSGSSTAVVFGTSTGSITCTASTLTGAVSGNPGAGTPGDVGFGVTSWTFSSCTDTIPFLTIASVQTSGPPSAAWFDGDAPLLAIDGPNIMLRWTTNVVTPITAWPLQAGYGNGGATATFLNQTMHNVTTFPPGYPTTWLFNATYGPMRYAGSNVTLAP